MDDTTTFVIWAGLLGGLSAVSLPLGSAVGLATQPRASITSFMAAFGAGALIAALSIELVAPTVNALVEGGSHGNASVPGDAGDAHHTDDPVQVFLRLIGGCIVGGALFVLLDQLINAHGGFLRKSATTIAYFSTRKRKRNKKILEFLCQVEILRKVPVEEIQRIVEAVKPVSFQDNEVLFDQGDTGECLYFIESGEIELFHDGEPLKILKAGEILGEIALLTSAPRTARAVAKGHVVLFQLNREDFDRIRSSIAELDEAARALASERIDELQERRDRRAAEAMEWAHQASKALRVGQEIPSPHEIRIAKQEHSGAPMAIWLGILLDGVPESFVIGSSFFALIAAKTAAGGTDLSFFDLVPYTLIAGLFLSNFPEAMSSSIGMRYQGWKPTKIFFMWFALMVVTALGAVVGYVVGGSFSHGSVVFIEGMAAGAMLTMIAATMLPEAVHLGGPNVVGLSTLMGFLSAIAFKLIE